MYNFGPITSQGDTQLIEYFHITNQISLKFSQKFGRNGFIMVVRPGGGKTALFTWLSRGPHGKKVISINNDVVRFIIKDDETATSDDHRILISAELFTALISEIFKNEKLPALLKAKCEDYLTNTWGSLWSFFGTKFEGLQILGCGFSLQASDRQNYLDKIRKEKNSKLLLLYSMK
jgi:hypothetical protein